MPKVSVVIPTYNALAYLPAAIESVLQQTFSDFEIVIVDDGSSDDTVDWVNQLQDPRLRLITQANQGAAAARNMGVVHAQGDYVAFLDADDLWRPDKLARQVEQLDAHPRVGLVHCWTEFTNAQGEHTGKIMTSHGQGDVWQTMVVYNLLRCGSTAMVRRDCFQRLGYFDTNLRYAEDWDMWLRIAADNDFALINEPLVLYREHPGNKSKNYEGQLESFCRIIDKAIAARPNPPQFLRRRAYGRAHLHGAWRALLLAENVDRAAILLRQALAYSPKLHFSSHCLHLKLQLARRQNPILGWPINLVLAARRRIPNFKALAVD